MGKFYSGGSLEELTLQQAGTSRVQQPVAACLLLLWDFFYLNMVCLASKIFIAFFLVTPVSKQRACV